MQDKNFKFDEIDCNRVLAKYFKDGNYKLIKFSIPKYTDDSEGYLSDHIIINMDTVANDKKMSLTFFVKTFTTDLYLTNEFLRSGNIFNKEIYCYKFFDEAKQQFPAIDISFAPEYYYSKENDYIVLEDLNTSGYETLSKLSTKHVEVAIVSLAKFHSVSILYEEMKSKTLNRKYTVLEDYGEWLQESIYRNDEEYLGYKSVISGLNAVIALVELLPDGLISASELKEKIKSLLTVNIQSCDDVQKIKFRKVWSHGDIYIKNLMFRCKNGNPIDCKIFDYQLQRYQPPSHDLCSLLFENLDEHQKQCYLDDYFNLYYDTLKHELQNHGFDIADILSEDEFNITCNISMPFTILNKTLFLSLNGSSAEDFKIILKDKEYYENLIFYDRTDHAINMFKNNERYNSTLKYCLMSISDQFYNKFICRYDCYKIIKRKLNTTKYTFLNYELSEESEHLLKLMIKIEEENETRNLHFTVKTNENSTNNQIIAVMVKHKLALWKECFGTCYLMRSNEVMVFDDFLQNGYVAVTFDQIYDYSTTLCILKKLAKLHAGFIILKDKLATTENKLLINDQPSRIKSEFKSITQQVLDEVLHVSGFTNTIKLDDMKKCIEKVMQNYPESINQETDGVYCKNLWAHSVFIKFESKIAVDCLFSDIKIWEINTPAHDLMVFLDLFADNELRKKFSTEFIKVFYAELKNSLHNSGFNNEICSYQEFINQCNTALLFSKIYSFYCIYDKLTLFSTQSLKLEKTKNSSPEYVHLAKKLTQCMQDILKMQ